LGAWNACSRFLLASSTRCFCCSSAAAAFLDILASALRKYSPEATMGRECSGPDGGWNEDKIDE